MFACVRHDDLPLPGGQGERGVGLLVVQSPRIGVISDLKVENEGEDPGRGGEDGEG